MSDVVVVIVFVAIGRHVHDHGVRLSGLISTSWPFIVGLAAGWGIVVARRTNGATIGAGAIVVIATTVIGMLVRVIAGQGTAVAFIIVAVGFLGLAMLGWRVASGIVRRSS